MSNLTKIYKNAMSQLNASQKAVRAAEEKLMAAQREMLESLTEKVRAADAAGTLKYEGEPAKILTYRLEVEDDHAKAWLLLIGVRKDSKGGNPKKTTIGPVFLDDPEIGLT